LLREIPVGTCQGEAVDRQKVVSREFDIPPSSSNEGCSVVLLVLSAIKLVAEIALMCLLGQGVLAMLAGEKRQQNFFYQLLTILTRPFTATARLITPRQVGDHQVPFVAFFLLLLIWAVVTFEKIRLCVDSAMAGCQ
jgi:hypothetical protein